MTLVRLSTFTMLIYLFNTCITSLAVTYLIIFVSVVCLVLFLRKFSFSVEPGPLAQLGCGTISGAVGATCVYPLQVIRTR